MAATDIELEPAAVGDVRRVRVTLTKDGAAWDLTSAVVTLRIGKPNRTTVLTRTMTAEDAAGGVAYYDTLTTDLDAAGVYTMAVTVVDGAVTLTYPHEISMEVVSVP